MHVQCVVDEVEISDISTQKEPKRALLIGSAMDKPWKFNRSDAKSFAYCQQLTAPVTWLFLSHTQRSFNNCFVCADLQNECNESCLTRLDLVVYNKSSSQHVSINVNLLQVRTKHDLCLLAVIKWFKNCKHPHLDKTLKNIQWLKQQILLHIFLNFFFLFALALLAASFFSVPNYPFQIFVEAFVFVFRYKNVAIICLATFLGFKSHFKKLIRESMHFGPSHWTINKSLSNYLNFP